MSLLVSRGPDEEAVRLGSIQEKSIRFAGEVIDRHAPRGALKALHIGNYVGLSLAGLSDLLTRHDPESLVVSIDPNLPHLGVVDPETHTLAVLGHFGLQGNNVLIRGYSLGGSAAGPGASSACKRPASTRSPTWSVSASGSIWRWSTATTTPSIFAKRST